MDRKCFACGSVKSGATLEVGEACDECGVVFGSMRGSAAVAKAADKILPPKGEQVFLDSGDTKVTHSRFVTGRQTFALSGVTSVRIDPVKPANGAPILMILVGLILLVPASSGAEGLYGFAFIFMVIGVGMLALRKTKYVLMLHSASGEARALESADKAMIQRIHDAITEAIIARG